MLETNRAIMYPGWALFILYYVATYAATATAILYYLGLQRVSQLVAAFLALQGLRLLPGARVLVKSINYIVCLCIYRVNYLVTLSFFIGTCLTPFAYVVSYTSNLGFDPFSVALGLATVFIFTLWWRAESDRKQVREYPETGAKKIAVIGGGVAGIVAAKECLDEGHIVVGFDRANVLGGVWNSGDDLSKRTTGRTLSSSSRSNSFFGDFPMPSESADKASMYPTHYTEEDYRNYLLSYADHFGVSGLYRLETHVTSVDRDACGQWVVKYATAGEDLVEVFDFVVVATGLNQHCAGLNMNASANVCHTASYRGNSQYAGKRVVIVGLGESSSDASAEIASVAKHVDVVVRSPVLLLPRNTFGKQIAPDHKLSALVLRCPQIIRTMKLLSQTVGHGPLNVVSSRLLGLEGEFGVTLSDKSKYEDNWSWEWWKLFIKLGPMHPGGEWGITRGQVTKTSPVVHNYRKGQVAFHTSDVAKSDGRTVILQDGTVISDVDAVVNATGYNTVWPFLPEPYSSHCTKDRYRLVFHPDLPNMAFIGFARGGVGSIMQGIEMQARWTALVASGKRRLAESKEMRDTIESHKRQMIGKWATKVTMVYCNALARYEVGCEPDLSKLFLQSPKAWFYLMAGPYCSSMYRLTGPHATAATAVKFFEAGTRIVQPLEYLPQQALELLLGGLTRFWTSIPPFSFIRLSKPMRQLVTPFSDLNY